MSSITLASENVGTLQPRATSFATSWEPSKPLNASLDFMLIISIALRGFAARLTDQQIDLLKQHPWVADVEPDGRMQTKAQQLPWGIDRIDADLSSTQAGDGQGRSPT